MAMALDSVNKEKVFKANNFKISVKLSDNNFVVRVGVVVDGTFDRDSLNIGKYVISREDIIENVYSDQGKRDSVSGEKYNEAIRMLKDVLNIVEIENLCQNK